jgi:predicted Zn-dependent peptidase
MGSSENGTTDITPNSNSGMGRPFGGSGPTAYHDYRLANGLRVLLHEDHTTPMVTINVLYHVGSKDEEPGRTGFAHLFEHLMFDGSKNVERGGYDRYCTMVGGENNAFTTSDITDYHLSLPSEQFPLGIWLESDRMAEFAIQEVSLQTQKRVVLEEKKQTHDDAPYGELSSAMRELSYDPRHPYSWDTIGSDEDISAATMEDVREFYTRFYVPDGTVLVVAGDFDQAEAEQLIGDYFGSIPSNGTPPLLAQAIDRTPLLHYGRRRRIHRDNIPFNGVFLGYHVPSVTDPDFPAVDLIASILADGESSRLYRKLEYSMQIASEAEAFVDDGEFGSMLYLYAIGQNKRVGIAALEKALRGELASLANDGVSKRELEKVRNRKVTRIAHSLQSISNRAERLAWFTTVLNQPNLAFHEADLYASITVDDIHRVARRWFSDVEPNVVEYEAS